MQLKRGKGNLRRRCGAYLPFEGRSSGGESDVTSLNPPRVNWRSENKGRDEDNDFLETRGIGVQR